MGPGVRDLPAGPQHRKGRRVLSSPGDPDQAAAEAPVELPCSPCRGTGTVISNLGGKRSEVTCPWCEGNGIQPPRDHDAQANAPQAAGGAPEPEADPPPAAA